MTDVTPDLIDLLRADHDHLLLATRELPELPFERPEHRLLLNERTQELIMAASQHEAVEEQYFWPLVREALPDGDELADRGLEQERAGKWVLHHLSHRVPENPDYRDLLLEAAETIRHHVDFEQELVWPDVLARVDLERRQTIGRQLVRSRPLAPTRPHPGTPTGPGGRSAAARLAGAADHVADLVTGRGRRFRRDRETVTEEKDNPELR